MPVAYFWGFIKLSSSACSASVLFAFSLILVSHFGFDGVEYAADVKIPENSYGKQDYGYGHYHRDKYLPVHDAFPD